MDDQRFSHLEPGKISAELRKALGLQKNETPHFVYLMRRLGYPPGWLEEAKFVHSNLDMFDIDGKHVKSCVVKKAGLDESRIVDYPGFNVPLQKGMKDVSTSQMMGYDDMNYQLSHLNFFYRWYL